MSTERK